MSVTFAAAAVSDHVSEGSPGKLQLNNSSLTTPKWGGREGGTSDLDPESKDGILGSEMEQNQRQAGCVNTWPLCELNSV